MVRALIISRMQMYQSHNQVQQQPIMAQQQMYYNQQPQHNANPLLRSMNNIAQSGSIQLSQSKKDLEKKEIKQTTGLEMSEFLNL
jgi:hypothetical protein